MDGGVHAPMLEVRTAFGMCVIAGEVYACGGRDHTGRTLTSVERYSPLRNKWSPVATMPIALYFHCTCSVNGYMYVLGGILPSNISNLQVFKYDPESDSWSQEVASMPASRRYSN